MCRGFEAGLKGVDIDLDMGAYRCVRASGRSVWRVGVHVANDFVAHLHSHYVEGGRSDRVE